MFDIYQDQLQNNTKASANQVTEESEAEDELFDMNVLAKLKF